ncbi:MAG: DUF2147 domain-containing protein [bacterium]|nr:DUF2147 domain-containing protein [bacterium]
MKLIHLFNNPLNPHRNAIYCGIFIIMVIFACPLLSQMETADKLSPVGMWKTIDDKTKEVKSIVKIWKHEDGTLKGRIEKIFPKPGEDPDPKCDKCKGDKKNQRILGMEFMWGFNGSGSNWEKGKIIDPENGKTYNCELEVVEKGKTLKVYGYVKVIFKIGRTQKWIRQTPSKG